MYLVSCEITNRGSSNGSNSSTPDFPTTPTTTTTSGRSLDIDIYIATIKPIYLYIYIYRTDQEQTMAEFN